MDVKDAGNESINPLMTLNQTLLEERCPDCNEDSMRLREVHCEEVLLCTNCGTVCKAHREELVFEHVAVIRGLN